MRTIAPMTRRPRPYQRRRRIPVIALVTVLAAAALVAWTAVLVNASGPARGRTCPVPAAGPVPGQSLPADALNGVAPVPPAAVKVRVLNAGGQRGQANLVAAQFGDLGFAEAAPPDNDPLYPGGDMECTGQVRFGPAGEAGASTVALVLPCAELVRDTRTDDTVDVSVGTAFGDLNPVRAARDALDQLSSPSGGSGDAAAAPGPPPTVDPGVLAQARGRGC
jgi:LytR cell envelope-related transcriptional attenuator